MERVERAVGGMRAPGTRRGSHDDAERSSNVEFRAQVRAQVRRRQARERAALRTCAWDDITSQLRRS